jgi:uncharacterized protein (TIGR02246 family)
MIPSTLKLGTVRVVLLLTLALAAPSVGRGDDKEPARAEDQAAVRARLQEFLKALAKGDAKQVAAFWTATGEYMSGDDLTLRGRDNIEKAYAEHLKKKQPGAVELDHDSVRFLSEDAAIQEGVFLVKRPNPAERSRHRFSALFVRVKGQWHFGLLREWEEGPSLQELAWLVGTWSFKTDGSEVRMAFEWTDNKTFLLARFTMKQEDRTVTGVQLLALDPATKSLKSWTFESDGSLGEAVWTRTEKGWTAKSTGVTPDGEKVRAKSMITPIDENSYTWQSTDRTIDDEKAPDIGPVKVVRERKGP